MRRLTVILLALLCCCAARAQKIDDKFVESYTQYVPMVADLGLGLAGVEAKHNFLDRGIEAAIGGVCLVGLVDGVLKNVVSEERPDGSAFNSFPSGHTATAFLGAELVRMEYGWGWGAGAYALAASVGVMRVCHERHWWWDTLAGAGVGILCANIGGWLLEPTRSLLGLNDEKIMLAANVDPVSGALCASVRINLE